jgi:hypothetical protein
LDQVVNKYRGLDDEGLLTKLFNQVASHSVPTKTGPLLKETQAEYKSCARILVHALADNKRNGWSRSSLPSLAEMVLRPHGPRLVTDLIPACSDRRKVAIVASSLIARAFPELSEDDRATTQANWNACLRAARAAFEQQKRACAGYGGNMEESGLPRWDKIQCVINSLQPGDPDMLILRLYAELKFKAPYSTNAVLMNPGHIRLYKPNEKHNAPTQQQMAAVADDDEAPRGWLVLDKDPKKDQLTLVLGFEPNGKGVVMSTTRLPATLSQEVRVYMSKRHPNQRYLLVDNKHTVDIQAAVPYLGGIQARASYLARVNRLLMKHFQCRLRQYRVACALHHAEAAKREMHAELDM